MAGDPVEIDLSIPDNTGPITQSFQNLAALSKQMRDDLEAMDSGMADVSDRASRMREYWQQNLGFINDMKTALEQIAAQAQGNQSIFSNNVTLINEMLSNIRALGGNMGQAMQMLGVGNLGGMLPGMNPQQMAANYAQAAGISGQLSRDPFYAANATQSQDFSGYVGRRPSYGDPRGGGGGGGIGESDGSGFLNDATSAPLAGTIARRSSTYVDPMQTMLEANYPGFAGNYIPNLRGASASPAIQAYNYTSQRMNQMLGGGQFANTMTSAYQQFLGGLGVNPADLATAHATRTATDPTGTVLDKFERKMLSIADKFSRFMSSGTGSALTQTAGLFGMSRSFLGAAETAMSTIQGGTSYQSQYGFAGGLNPSLADTAALYVGNRIRGAANPYMSNQDYMNAQLTALGLGLRGSLSATGTGLLSRVPGGNFAAGSDVLAFTNMANALKKYYGLDIQSTANLASTAMAYGIDMPTFMQGFGASRTLAAQTTTSQTYAMGAYQTAAGTAASMGFSSAAAAAIGASAVRFGVNDTVAQAAGQTGYELMGTQIGTALFARAAGVPYMEAYAAAQKMGTDKAMKLSDQAAINLLRNLGVDPAKITKKSDLNPLAMKLALVLPQLGVSTVTTPENAVAWTWELIQRSRGYSGAGDKSLTSSTDIMNTNGTAPNQTLSVPSATQAATYGDSRVQAHALSAASVASAGTPASANSLLNTNPAVAGGVNVQVGLTPSAQQILTAVVKSQQTQNTSPSARLNQ